MPHEPLNSHSLDIELELAKRIAPLAWVTSSNLKAVVARYFMVSIDAFSTGLWEKGILWIKRYVKLNKYRTYGFIKQIITTSHCEYVGAS